MANKETARYELELAKIQLEGEKLRAGVPMAKPNDEPTVGMQRPVQKIAEPAKGSCNAVAVLLPAQQDHIPTFLHRGASGSVTQVVCIMGVLLMT